MYKISNECLTQIVQAVKNDQHTESVRLLAVAMGLTRYQKILSYIERIHALQGYLPSPLRQYRQEILNILFELYKARGGEVSFEEVQGLFFKELKQSYSQQVRVAI